MSQKFHLTAHIKENKMRVPISNPQDLKISTLLSIIESRNIFSKTKITFLKNDQNEFLFPNDCIVDVLDSGDTIFCICEEGIEEKEEEEKIKHKTNSKDLQIKVKKLQRDKNNSKNQESKIENKESIEFDNSESELELWIDEDFFVKNSPNYKNQSATTPQTITTTTTTTTPLTTPLTTPQQTRKVQIQYITKTLENSVIEDLSDISTDLSSDDLYLEQEKRELELLKSKLDLNLSEKDDLLFDFNDSTNSGNSSDSINSHSKKHSNNSGSDSDFRKNEEDEELLKEKQLLEQERNDHLFDDIFDFEDNSESSSDEEEKDFQEANKEKIVKEEKQEKEEKQFINTAQLENKKLKIPRRINFKTIKTHSQLQAKKETLNKSSEENGNIIENINIHNSDPKEEKLEFEMVRSKKEKNFLSIEEKQIKDNLETNTKIKQINENLNNNNNYKNIQNENQEEQKEKKEDLEKNQNEKTKKQNKIHKEKEYEYEQEQVQNQEQETKVETNIENQSNGNKTPPTNVTMTKHNNKDMLPLENQKTELQETLSNTESRPNPESESIKEANNNNNEEQTSRNDTIELKKTEKELIQKDDINDVAQSKETQEPDQKIKENHKGLDANKKLTQLEKSDYNSNGQENKEFTVYLQNSKGGYKDKCRIYFVKKQMKIILPGNQLKACRLELINFQVINNDKKIGLLTMNEQYYVIKFKRNLEFEQFLQNLVPNTIDSKLKINLINLQEEIKNNNPDFKNNTDRNKDSDNSNNSNNSISNYNNNNINYNNNNNYNNNINAINNNNNNDNNKGKNNKDKNKDKDKSIGTNNNINNETEELKFEIELLNEKYKSVGNSYIIISKKLIKFKNVDGEIYSENNDKVKVSYTKRKIILRIKHQNYRFKFQKNHDLKKFLQLLKTKNNIENDHKATKTHNKYEPKNKKITKKRSKPKIKNESNNNNNSKSQNKSKSNYNGNSNSNHNNKHKKNNEIPKFRIKILDNKLKILGASEINFAKDKVTIFDLERNLIEESILNIKFRPSSKSSKNGKLQFVSFSKLFLIKFHSNELRSNFSKLIQSKQKEKFEQFEIYNSQTFQITILNDYHKQTTEGELKFYKGQLHFTTKSRKIKETVNEIKHNKHKIKNLISHLIIKKTDFLIKFHNNKEREKFSEYYKQNLLLFHIQTLGSKQQQQQKQQEENDSDDEYDENDYNHYDDKKAKGIKKIRKERQKQNFKIKLVDKQSEILCLGEIVLQGGNVIIKRDQQSPIASTRNDIFLIIKDKSKALITMLFYKTKGRLYIKLENHRDLLKISKLFQIVKDNASNQPHKWNANILYSNVDHLYQKSEIEIVFNSETVTFNILDRDLTIKKKISFVLSTNINSKISNKNPKIIEFKINSKSQLILKLNSKNDATELYKFINKLKIKSNSSKLRRK
ncbi:hypothetical protein M0812_23556 [Anaeramoeba flamelloides]|uniref:Uncharacterized protein n=1 Tax=Anaeramoeba flamelloides TaxID=1746091 RepID=A0AAV7YL40_9EUKA|nr:hypothetical protein M0812_23556 [Anaeramoeba flamelloides]